MDRLTIRALIENKFPHFTDEDKMAMSAWYSDKEGKRINVTLSIERPTRSRDQNNYLWGVVYEMMANENGSTTEEIHAAMKEQLLPRRFVTIGEKEYPLAKSTKILTTVQFEQYVMQVREFAGRELQINIPLPNEAPL